MSSSPANPLSPDNVLQLMSKSLPLKESTKIKDANAAIALLCHACMLAVGFRLVGLDEDHTIDSTSEQLPAEWSRDSSSSYAFRYKHPESSTEYQIKVNRLFGKAMIAGHRVSDDKTVQCEANAADFIANPSFKNITLDSSDTKASLQQLFFSTSHMKDLISLFSFNIMKDLANIPDIKESDAAESASQTATTAATRDFPIRPEAAPEHDPLRDDQPQPARPYPFDDPLAAQPRRSGPVPDFQPPGFEDEFELQRPARGMGQGQGLHEPFGRIGERDLYPPGLGPHDPLRIGPGGGGGGARGGGGGGMHPTFDDPLFGGQGAGIGYDPRAPPGARYDPVGPGDGPPNLRSGPRFPGRGGGGGGFGGPPNPFSGFGSGDFI